MDKQLLYKDKDIREKLIQFLQKKYNQPICEEVSLGGYRTDLFIANSSQMYAYEIKSGRDDVKRFFESQWSEFRWATERLWCSIVLVIPRLHLEKVKELAKQYIKESGIKLQILTYGDRLGFKQETNLYSSNWTKNTRESESWNIL